jgi:hypothetical protein
VTIFEDRRVPAGRLAAAGPLHDTHATALQILGQTLQKSSGTSGEDAAVRAAKFEAALHAKGYAIVPVPDPQRVIVATAADGAATLTLAGLSIRQCRDFLEVLARMQPEGDDD